MIADHLVPIECACGHTKFGLYLGIATEQNYITYSTNVVSKYLLTYLKVHIWTVGIWIIYVFWTMYAFLPYTCFCCSKWSILCDKICSFEIFMVWLLFTTYINHYIWSKYRRKWVFLELVLLWLHFTNSMPRKHTLESKSI